MNFVLLTYSIKLDKDKNILFHLSYYSISFKNLLFKVLALVHSQPYKYPQEPKNKTSFTTTPHKYNHFLGLNMSSSIAPASLATSLASSVSTYQQAKTSNPLSWTDDKILETVYITHVHTGERFDVESLFILTSNILKRSTAVADSVVSKVQILYH